MAKRLYIPPSGTAPITPNPSANWTMPEGHVHLPANSSKGSTSFSELSSSTYLTYYEVLIAQFVSEQWAAHDFTTGETIKFQIRPYTYVPGSCTLRLCIRVCSADGATIRGTLFEGNAPTNIGNYVNRSLGAGGAAVNVQNNVSMQNGDRILIEVGGHFVSAGSIAIYCGENEANDLPENETSTDQYCPWVEFSATLAPYEEGPSPIGPSGGIASGENVSGTPMMRGTIQSEA